MTVTVFALNTPDYTAQHLRQAQSLAFGAPALSLQVRSGVRYTNGLDFNVTVSGLTATVTPGQAILQSPTFAQGGYAFISDGNVGLTIANRHASLTRIDTVYLMVRDNVVDSSGAEDGRVLYQAGTAGSGVPPTITGHMLKIADITVPPGAGLITVTDRRVWTAALGGIVRCRTVADIVSATAGTYVHEEDTETLYQRRASSWQAVFKPPSAWTNFSAGWFNGTFTSLSGFQLRYWAESGGFVNLSGRIRRTDGNLSGSLTGVLVLPVGLRPAVEWASPTTIATGPSVPSVNGRINIETDGAVNILLPGSQEAAWMSFDGVRFPVFQ